MRAHAADPVGKPIAPAAVAKVPSWFIHVGAGAVILNESARMNVGGAPFPGGSIEIAPQVTPIIELGYFVTPNIGVSFTGGLPPKISIKGIGTAAPLGTLGTAVYGPMTLTAHYHFTDFGRIQPYVGAGVAFMKIFSTKDRALTNLKINDAAGPALQVGVDFMIDQNWSAFIDVKKAFLRTITTGNLGAVPTRSKATIDPLVVSTGVGYRF
jgi:outer membrane protein